MSGNSVEDKIQALYGGQKSMLILVIGESSRGKSTSLRNLNPDTTFVVNVMGKILPFPRGVRYVEGKNMYVCREAREIIAKLKEVSEKRPEITDIVIDDGQYIMASEFVRKAMEKGYDKFSIMAQNAWNLLTTCNSLRAGLKVYFLNHEEETQTGKRKMKTIGRMLDDKLTPEGLSSIVLYSELFTEKDKANKYVFSTQSDGSTNAKSPLDMFPRLIPNDLSLVSRRIDEYYEGVALVDSKFKKELET